jgi:DNA-binding Xre family transcriptional regulator
MSRVVDYHWHLAELMARRGLHTSTKLAPLLHQRGVELSASQVYRLVTQRPERVSLKVLAALCDIFDCGLDDLITTTATDGH